jgi:hypothetical protein
MLDARSTLDKPCCSYSMHQGCKGLGGNFHSRRTVYAGVLCGRSYSRSLRRCQRDYVKIMATDHQKSHTESVESPSHIGTKKVVILGGTGRVGASTAEALLKWLPDLDLVLSSRSKENWSTAISKRPLLERTQFVECDINSVEAVRRAIRYSLHFLDMIET